MEQCDITPNVSYIPNVWCDIVSIIYVIDDEKNIWWITIKFSIIL